MMPVELADRIMMIIWSACLVLLLGCLGSLIYGVYQHHVLMNQLIDNAKINSVRTVPCKGPSYHKPWKYGYHCEVK